MNRLKELREKSSLTQEELAKELKTSKLTISNWEHEKYLIRADKAKIIADYFDVSVAYLLGYSNEMTEHYFLNVAKANLLDILMETGFIKHSHIEYGLKELDPIDRNLLEKEWSDENDSNN